MSKIESTIEIDLSLSVNGDQYDEKLIKFAIIRKKWKKFAKGSLQRKISGLSSTHPLIDLFIAELIIVTT